MYCIPKTICGKVVPKITAEINRAGPNLRCCDVMAISPSDRCAGLSKTDDSYRHHGHLHFGVEKAERDLYPSNPDPPVAE